MTLSFENIDVKIYRFSSKKRGWFSGIITACHAVDPGSIPGPRILLPFAILIMKRIDQQASCGNCFYADGIRGVF